MHDCKKVIRKCQKVSESVRRSSEDFIIMHDCRKKSFWAYSKPSEDFLLSEEKSFGKKNFYYSTLKSVTKHILQCSVECSWQSEKPLLYRAATAVMSHCWRFASVDDPDTVRHKKNSSFVRNIKFLSEDSEEFLLGLHDRQKIS